MSIDPDYIKLRHTAKWFRLRATAMQRCGGMCEICHEEKAVEAHHIIPLEDGVNYEEKARLCYDINNVQCLCRECHLRVHRQLGVGKARTRRVTQKKVADFVKTFFGDDVPPITSYDRNNVPPYVYKEDEREVRARERHRQFMEAWSEEPKGGDTFYFGGD